MADKDSLINLFYKNCPKFPTLKIVFKSDTLIFVNKPAGLVTHPTKGDEYSSLVSRMSLSLRKNGLPDHPIHLINRLDRETSGLVVFALCDDNARLLRSLWSEKKVIKTYICITHGYSDYHNHECNEPLGNDEESPIYVKDKVRTDGKISITHFTTIKNFNKDGYPYSLIKATPRTGRKHQIRIHLSHLGHPIVGDKLYGKDELCYLRFVDKKLSTHDYDNLKLFNQALHGQSLEFLSESLPFRKIACQPDRDFEAFHMDI